MGIRSNLDHIRQELPAQVTLVAVSKTKPADRLQEAYAAGQRDFGENYVQELVAKQAQLPADIRWHFIGHLQRNKVKYLAPFVYMIHGVDSFKLLQEINKEAAKAGRTVLCLLQVHIAQEETKFGLDEKELLALLAEPALANCKNIQLRGLMGMASFTQDTETVKEEFRKLKLLFDSTRELAPEPALWDTLSMGMSGDYALAIQEGSTLVRIGSSIFGSRN